MCTDAMSKSRTLWLYALLNGVGLQVPATASFEKVTKNGKGKK